ncbi:hypothetical protein PpBr36_00481 [Pyricularia pennisetigena]|uniref:hypothetical protein n=1 Tax=Pyricularia pennisetigena TaxID=1578925 RepID=UPI00114D9A67|nr:hypothetical protein PpBr36_00481 [Pyricularia pennisetigena]TLS28181.1 hypothetical protein PpBr36_00481 [Pyricularia pennisetigena]
MFLVSHGVCSGDNSQRNSILQDRGKMSAYTQRIPSITPSLGIMYVRLHNVGLEKRRQSRAEWTVLVLETVPVGRSPDGLVANTKGLTSPMIMLHRLLIHKVRSGFPGHLPEQVRPLYFLIPQECCTER